MIIKKHILSLAIIAAMLFSGCTTAPTEDIRIEVQTDPKANLSGYKSYAWLASAIILNDSYGQWEPPEFDADNEIMYLIDRELRKRGMSENTVNPDLYLAFAAGIDMDALGLKTDPQTKIDMLENVPQGGLVVALVDSDSGFVVWLGLATAEIQEESNAQMAKARLDYAVSNLLKKIPK